MLIVKGREFIFYFVLSTKAQKCQYLHRKVICRKNYAMPILISLFSLFNGLTSGTEIENNQIDDINFLNCLIISCPKSFFGLLWLMKLMKLMIKNKLGCYPNIFCCNSVDILLIIAPFINIIILIIKVRRKLSSVTAHGLFTYESLNSIYLY